MFFLTTTKRLKLKHLKSNNKAARQVLDFYCRNREVFEPVEPKRYEKFYTLDYQKAMLTVEEYLHLQFKNYRYWIYLRDDPTTIIGSVCFYECYPFCFKQFEVGYKFDSHYWHQGYASEAMERGIWLMSIRGYHYLQAHVMPDNTDSIRLLERLGFRCEGLIREYANIQGKPEDHLKFSLVT